MTGPRRRLGDGLSGRRGELRVLPPSGFPRLSLTAEAERRPGTGAPPAKAGTGAPPARGGRPRPGPREPAVALALFLTLAVRHAPAEGDPGAHRRRERRSAARSRTPGIPAAP